MHSAFAECIRGLYLLPTQLSMTAIHEHTEMRQVAARLSKEAGTPVKLPSYYQVRREIHRLSREPDLVAVREGAKSIPLFRANFLCFTPKIVEHPRHLLNACKEELRKCPGFLWLGNR